MKKNEEEKMQQLQQQQQQQQLQLQQLQQIQLPPQQLQLQIKPQQLLQQQQHNFSNFQSNGYKAGDRVLAMWIGALWEFFPGTIFRRISEDKYEINWDDGDQSGRLLVFFKKQKKHVILSN